MSEIKEKIKAKIEEIRPSLQADGGDLEFVGVDEDKARVRVRLQGACVGCPLAEMTLQETVAKELKQVWPDLKEVVAVNNDS